MISLLVAFVLYEGNADWYWWIAFIALLAADIFVFVVNVLDGLRKD